MNKLFATLFSLFLFATATQAQIVITEILYNIPGSGENEEYVELYNNTASPINLTGYQMRDNSSTAIDLTFGNVTIAANDYFIIAKDSLIFLAQYGFSPDYSWTAGLNNGGDDVILYDDLGNIIDSVGYNTSAPWPTEGSQGYAIQLCDVNTDNADGANWGYSNDSAAVNSLDPTVTLYGTPGAANTCMMPAAFGNYSYQMIDAINDVDVDGVAVSDGDSVELRGVVHCQDFDGNAGYSFALVEYNNDGITVFNFNDVNGYAVTEGDSLHAYGVVDQFNGLLQLAVDSIELISQGNALVTPMAVTMLDETTENKVLTLDSVTLANPAQWGNAGGSFNADVVTLNNDTLAIRVDGDLPLADSLAPTGYFDIHGIGNQFDNSSPYTGGYQLLACDYMVSGGGTVTPPAAAAALVITEINYNVPGADSVEFVEIYNNDTAAVDMTGYEISNAIFYTFPTITLNAGDYLLITNDSIAFQNAFGIAAYEWNSGNSLNNTGETIILSSPSAALVDSVTYADSAPWPTGTDGQGASIQLCDINTNNADPTNWGASDNQTGVLLGGVEVLATPGSANTVCVTPAPVSYTYYNISEINGTDVNGEYDSLGVNVEIRGVVHCGNFATAPTASLQLLEYTNDGINAFVGSSSGINYTVTEGDSLHLFGSIGNFFGTLELTVDSLSVISTANPTLTPMDVSTAIDESMEHKLIQLNNVSLVNPADWTGSGSGFNVDVTDGTNTWQVRIDNDVDLYTQSAPVGTFNIYGFGGQFDTSSPYDSGYQLKACNSSITIVNSVNALNQEAIRIFPNPTSSILNVQAAQIDAVVITNTLGQQLINMQNVNDNNLQINTVDLAKGVYNITILSNGKLQTKQFVKQ